MTRGKPERPSRINCEDCGAVVKVAVKGKVPIWCAECRRRRRHRISIELSRAKRLKENPVQPCKMCGADLPQHKITRYKYCATCLPIYRQQYEKARRVQNLARDPDFDRRRDLWKHYRMRLEDWDALMAAQGGACAICGGKEPGGKGWQVDHDHDSGAIRGIVCHHCNLTLGHMRDRPDLCEAAAAYLEQTARTGEPWRPE